MKNKHQFIMGKHSLLEIMEREPGRIIRVFTSHRKGDLCSQIRSREIPLSLVSKSELSHLVSSHSHQCYVAEIKARPAIDLKSFLQKEREESTVLMLDSIYDPQNLGALFRAAECFGAEALVWSKNRGCPLTPTVSKASSGACQLMDAILVSNLAEAVAAFQKRGYQAVVADLSPKAEELSSFSFPEKTLLIMGSEGRGVQPLVQKKADHLVTIPMQGRLASLNVSQAASIFLAARFFSKKKPS